MAEPLKRQSAAPAAATASGAVRDAHTSRPRNDIGTARPRTHSGGQRRPGSRRTASRRPHGADKRSGARMLAPLALLVFAVICLAVLTSEGENGAVKESAPAQQSGAAAPAAKAPTRSAYRVKSGDSFGSIAEKTGVTVETLQQLNPEIDPRALQPGQRIKLK